HISLRRMGILTNGGNFLQAVAAQAGLQCVRPCAACSAARVTFGIRQSESSALAMPELDSSARAAALDSFSRRIRPPIPVARRAAAGKPVREGGFAYRSRSAAWGMTRRRCVGAGYSYQDGRGMAREPRAARVE